MKGCHCSICEELAKSPASRLAEALKSFGIYNALLHETTNLAVIPSLGPLCYGHCLIVPKFHSNNVLVSALEGSFESEIAEALGAIKKCFARDGILLVGEHGATNVDDTATLCSTTHGHLHVIPLPDMHEWTALQDVANGERCGGFDELLLSSSKRNEYLSMFTCRGTLETRDAVILDKKYFTSQYLRRHAGALLGTKQWDWHEDANTEVIMQMIKDYFQTNTMLKKVA